MCNTIETLKNYGINITVHFLYYYIPGQTKQHILCFIQTHKSFTWDFPMLNISANCLELNVANIRPKFIIFYIYMKRSVI